MLYKIEYSSRAIQDIDGFYDYIIFNYQDYFVASNAVKAIRKQIDSLKQNPRRKKFNNEYYYIRAKRYKIFYHISGNKIYIVRVFHSLQTPVLPDINPLML